MCSVRSKHVYVCVCACTCTLCCMGGKCGYPDLFVCSHHSSLFLFTKVFGVDVGMPSEQQVSGSILKLIAFLFKIVFFVSKQHVTLHNVPMILGPHNLTSYTFRHLRVWYSKGAIRKKADSTAQILFFFDIKSQL